MLLHEDKKALEEAIRATAISLSLPIEYVEKDYWVTFALKELATCDICEDVVFKGGTSLSKAYSLIARFSEDVDIAVLTVNLSKAQAARKVKKASKVIANISNIFNEIDGPDTSKNSHFRKVRFQYPRVDDSVPFEGQITDSLLLEINAFADPEPYQKMPLSCYIAEFLYSSGQGKTVAKFKLEAFEMNVLCTSRTICEKIMGLVKASFGDNYIDHINRKLRHLYDIHFLLGDKFTSEFIESSAFSKMVLKVIACDRSTFSSTPWFDIPLADACVFSNLEAIWPSLENTYNNEFKAMVVGDDIPTKESLINSMARIHRQLIKIDGN